MDCTWLGDDSTRSWAGRSRRELSPLVTPRLPRGTLRAPANLPTDAPRRRMGANASSTYAESSAAPLALSSRNSASACSLPVAPGAMLPRLLYTARLLRERPADTVSPPLALVRRRWMEDTMTLGMGEAGLEGPLHLFRHCCTMPRSGPCARRRAAATTSVALAPRLALATDVETRDAHRWAPLRVLVGAVSARLQACTPMRERRAAPISATDGMPPAPASSEERRRSGRRPASVLRTALPMVRAVLKAPRSTAHASTSTVHACRMMRKMPTPGSAGHTARKIRCTMTVPVTCMSLLFSSGSVYGCREYVSSTTSASAPTMTPTRVTKSVVNHNAHSRTAFCTMRTSAKAWLGTKRARPQHRCSISRLMRTDSDTASAVAAWFSSALAPALPAASVRAARPA